MYLPGTIIMDVRDTDYGEGGTIQGAYHISHLEIPKMEKLIKEINPK